MRRLSCVLSIVLGVLFSCCVTTLWAADLFVGAASVDICPDKPVFLAGQFRPRVSTGVEYPVTANVIAIESKKDGKGLDYAFFISIDTVVIRNPLPQLLRKAFAAEFPGFDADKLIVSATHTHSAPTLNDEAFPPQKGVQPPSEYTKGMVPKVIKAMRQAWDSRQQAKFSYGLGGAVVAYNRRAVYEDGSAVMYGKTNTPDFRSIEGFEDHDVNTMFFWDMKDKLIAMMVNVSCPSQETESNHEVSADYWGPTRNSLHKLYDKDVVILGQCGAAGDMSPHLRYRNAADDRMTRLRGLKRTEEIARRVVRGVEETYEPAASDKKTDVVFGHKYTVLSLPQRKATKKEYEECKAMWEKQKADPKDGRANWNRRIIERYEDLAKNPNPVFCTPVNVVRIGDTVVCTNQFELYTDFATRIKARSPAVQTFVAQLTNGAKNMDNPNSGGLGATYGSGGTYLPSERAVRGGGYGAVIQSNIVGPEGGQMIVEETLKMIAELWKK